MELMTVGSTSTVGQHEKLWRAQLRTRLTVESPTRYSSKILPCTPFCLRLNLVLWRV